MVVTPLGRTMFDEWTGVVFDLDGTVVRLTVEWETVEQRINTELATRGIQTEDRTVWTLLDTACEEGHLSEIEPMINEYELEGAERSVRLPLADAMPDLKQPIGVCSLNCEAACRRALAVHELDDDVDVVIGRDTVRPWKPDPTPLERAIEDLGVTPGEAVFIGDSAGDRRTAERAGVDFLSDEAALQRLVGDQQPLD